MGLGLLMHIIAKIVFVLVGYGIHIYLGKSLAPYIYGSIGVVMSIININYNFLSNGARQAASHLIASNKYDNRDLIKKSYIYQLIIALVLSVINYCGAGIFADILNQPELANYIRFTAFIIPFTAIYFIGVGILNGFKLLVYEAITVTLYPLARLSIIPFVEIVFEDSILGTVAGFFVAAVVGCLVSSLYVKKKVTITCQSAPKISHKEYGKQVIDFLAFFLCVTIILNMDMLFVNALVVDENEVGYYTGATNFSKVSYYLLSAIYLVALPTITNKYSKEDLKGCQETINDLLVLITSFILPIVTIAGPICSNLMEVLYTEEYRKAGIPTEILMISQFFLGIFVIFNILVCSTKDKKFSTLLGIAIVVIDAILCVMLIPRFSILGASLASLISNIIGCTIIYRKAICVYGHIWSKQLSVIVLANFILFAWMTVFDRIWASGNFFEVLLVCFIYYCIFILVLIGLKILPLKKIIKNITRK